MTHDEALSAAVEGCRVRPPHWQPGVYVEHSFSRGFLKCWPVDRPEDEPIRSQCDYRSTAEDEAAAWEALPDPRPPLAIDHSPVDSWGRSTIPAIAASIAPPAVVTGTGWQTGVRDAPITKSDKKREICGECDYEKSACVCPKPDANKWGTPKKEPNKWGM